MEFEPVENLFLLEKDVENITLIEWIDFYLEKTESFIISYKRKLESKQDHLILLRLNKLKNKLLLRKAQINFEIEMIVLNKKEKIFFDKSFYLEKIIDFDISFSNHKKDVKDAISFVEKILKQAKELDFEIKNELGKLKETIKRKALKALETFKNSNFSKLKNDTKIYLFYYKSIYQKGEKTSVFFEVLSNSDKAFKTFKAFSGKNNMDKEEVKILNNLQEQEKLESKLIELNDKILKLKKENEVISFTKNNNFYSSLIGLIKNKRKEMELTIKEISELLEISPTTYQNFEKGRGNINIILFFKIIDFFEIKLNLKS